MSELTSKMDDLENRSRRSNLRLVNLPEKVEKGNAAAFLEEWLPNVPGPETFPALLAIERAHKLPGAPQSSALRVIIMKFLNFRDKIRVMQAARKKGKIVYEGHHVMFFQDISTELHKKRKRFDGVKQQLRDLKMDYGIIYPLNSGCSTKGNLACLLILQVWSRLSKNWKPSRLAGHGSWDCTGITTVSDWTFQWQQMV